MPRLFTLHSRGLAATYADIENQALAQERAYVTTPGSVLERTNAGGFRYYALQQYGQDGRKRESYLAGPVGEPAAEGAAREAIARIKEQRDAVASARLLIREGFGAMSPKHHAVVAALANHGFFAGGGLLVGTHAFEVVLNKLGVRASSFATTDVDVARAARIVLKDSPPGGMLAMLRTSGLPIDEVPNFDPRDPPIKFKERGHTRFTVDLLVPARGTEPTTAFVAELGCHAIALPYFQYLVGESQPGAAISRNGFAAVRVPLPERLAIHKLLVARLRRGRGEKSRKDVRQAAVLIAALAELDPQALLEAWAKTPKAARRMMRESIEEMLPQLANHPEASELASGRLK